MLLLAGLELFANNCALIEIDTSSIVTTSNSSRQNCLIANHEIMQHEENVDTMDTAQGIR